MLEVLNGLFQLHSPLGKWVSGRREAYKVATSQKKRQTKAATRTPSPVPAPAEGNAGQREQQPQANISPPSPLGSLFNDHGNENGDLFFHQLFPEITQSKAPQVSLADILETIQDKKSEPHVLWTNQIFRHIFRLICAITNERKQLTTSTEVMVDFAFHETFLIACCHRIFFELVALSQRAAFFESAQKSMQQMQADLTEVIHICQAIFHHYHALGSPGHALLATILNKITSQVLEAVNIQHEVGEMISDATIGGPSISEQKIKQYAERMRAIRNSAYDLIKIQPLAIQEGSLKRVSGIGPNTPLHEAIIAATTASLEDEKAVAAGIVLPLGSNHAQWTIRLVELNACLNALRQLIERFKAIQEQEAVIVRNVIERTKVSLSAPSQNTRAIEETLQCIEANQKKEAVIMRKVTDGIQSCLQVIEHTAGTIDEANRHSFLDALVQLSSDIAGFSKVIQTHQHDLSRTVDHLLDEIQVAVLWHLLAMQLFNLAKTLQPEPAPLEQVLAGEDHLRNMLRSYERHSKDAQCEWPKVADDLQSETATEWALPALADGVRQAVWERVTAAHYVALAATFPEQSDERQQALRSGFAAVERMMKSAQSMAQYVSTATVGRVQGALSQSTFSHILALPVYCPTPIKDTVTESMVSLCQKLRPDHPNFLKHAKGLANNIIIAIQAQIKPILLNRRNYNSDMLRLVTAFSEELAELASMIGKSAPAHLVLCSRLEKLSDYFKQRIDDLNTALTAKEPNSHAPLFDSLIDEINIFLLSTHRDLSQFVMEQQALAMSEVTRPSQSSHLVCRTLEAMTWAIVAMHLKEIQWRGQEVMSLLQRLLGRVKAEKDNAADAVVRKDALVRPVTARQTCQVEQSVKESRLTAVLALSASETDPAISKIEQDQIQAAVIRKMVPLCDVLENGSGSIDQAKMNAQIAMQAVQSKINCILSDDRNQFVTDQDITQASFILTALYRALRELIVLAKFSEKVVHEDTEAYQTKSTAEAEVKEAAQSNSLISVKVVNAMQTAEKAVAYLQEQMTRLYDLQGVTPNTLSMRTAIQDCLVGLYSCMPPTIAPDAKFPNHKAPQFLAVNTLVQFVSEAHVLAMDALSDCAEHAEMINRTLESIARGAVVAAAQRLQRKITANTVALYHCPVSPSVSRRSPLSLGQFGSVNASNASRRSSGAGASAVTALSISP
jgi:hypothetical protein